MEHTELDIRKKLRQRIYADSPHCQSKNLSSIKESFIEIRPITDGCCKESESPEVQEKQREGARAGSGKERFIAIRLARLTYLIASFY